MKEDFIRIHERHMFAFDVIFIIIINRRFSLDTTEIIYVITTIRNIDRFATKIRHYALADLSLEKKINKITPNRKKTSIGMLKSMLLVFFVWNYYTHVYMYGDENTVVLIRCRSVVRRKRMR